MTPYAGRAHGSGVTAYELGPRHIDVEFEDGSLYRYDYDEPGREATQMMKGLAKEGVGLNTYINKQVRSDYARRLR